MITKCKAHRSRIGHTIIAALGTLLLAACQGTPKVVELAPLSACPIVDDSLWAACEFEDDLPDDPALAIVMLGRAFLECRSSMLTLREQLERSR